MAEKKKINESQMVKLIHGKKQNISQKDIKDVLDLFISISKDSLEKGVPVNLKGFVTLKCEEVGGKKIYSFKDGATVKLPSRTLPKASFNRVFINKIKKINNAG